MCNELLPKKEYDDALNMAETILSQPVEGIELTDKVPSINDMTDSNKVFMGKLSVLFVDMRKSTDLTDELQSKKMVKVYRAFIRIVVQAIRYSGGQSRQFAGDGVLSVFQDDANSGNKITSCQKAVRAARYILTMIDFCLNPQLKKHLGDVAIGCGIGISTGTVMATKIGMRGKEHDESAENELGIAWVGSTTNYASHHCGLALPREIFIDDSTYKELGDTSDSWKAETRLKGSKPFSGYVAREYYLPLPDEIVVAPILSEEPDNKDATFIQEIFDETSERALALVDEISKKSAELSEKLKNVESKETQLNERENQLAQREDSISVLESKYEFDMLLDFIESVSYKLPDAQIQSLGKDYWNELIHRIEELGIKTDSKIYGFQSTSIAKIYKALQMYNEFYREVCNVAKCGFYISESDIKTILDETFLRSNLKDALQDYISSNGNDETSDNYRKLLNLMED